MIAAAALTAGFVLAKASPRRAVAPTVEPRSWSLQVTTWLRQGAGLCLAARSASALSALAPRYGARPAPSPRLASARLLTPVLLLGSRGEVTVSGRDDPSGFRCTVEASSGDAAALQRDLPALAASLGFARMATLPSRWPGEAAWRGRGGAAGVELFTAVPFVHGAPYGALLQFRRLP